MGRFQSPIAIIAPVLQFRARRFARPRVRFVRHRRHFVDQTRLTLVLASRLGRLIAGAPGTAVMR